MKDLRLQAKADRRVRLGHNWIFSNEVDTKLTPLAAFEPGELARVVDDARNPVGIAYVNRGALICARVLTRNVRADIDESWFAARLARAIALRDRIYPKPFYRAVYGDADGLPGLVIDRYGDIFVVQLNTAGMVALRDPLLAALRHIAAPRGIVLRTAGSVRSLEDIPPLDERLGDVPEDVEIIEYDMRLTAPLLHGQKTGYFFDQRDNRARLRRYIRSGDRVLDVFSYVGAWGVSAALAGAADVTCIDASGLALSYARRNGDAQGVGIETLEGDALAILTRLNDEGQRYDCLVLDPPALVKRKKDQAAGESHYLRLHKAAIPLVKDGGFLISASCSYHLAPERLSRIAFDAARACGRRFAILETHGQPPDHPVHPAMPETSYLKAIYTRL